MRKPITIQPARNPEGPLLSQGHLVAAVFMVALPNAATMEDVKEWIEVHLGAGTMEIDNPLARFSPEAFGGIVTLKNIKARIMADTAKGAHS